jgi:hypothetical protein
MIRSTADFSVFKLRILLLVVAVLASCLPLTAQTKSAQPRTAQSKTAQTNPAQTKTTEVTYPAALVDGGKLLFAQNCSFCHGRDAGGGESGPDLMDSDLVITDVSGNKIGPFVRVGRPENGIPRRRNPIEGPADVGASRSAIFRPATSRRAKNTSMVQGPARPATPRPETWPASPGVFADCNLRSGCYIRTTQTQLFPLLSRPVKPSPANLLLRMSSPSGLPMRQDGISPGRRVRSNSPSTHQPKPMSNYWASTPTTTYTT